MNGFADIGVLPQTVTWRGACVLARDAQGRVLMQLRDSNAEIAAPGQWCLFGGAVEPGENLETAAKREFFEETGIDLQADALHPLARFASQALAGGVVHVFALDRAVRPQELRLGEGAGFGFLTPEQVASFDLIENFRTLLLGIEEG